MSCSSFCFISLLLCCSPIDVLMMSVLGLEAFYTLIIKCQCLVHLSPWPVIFRSACPCISQIKWKRKEWGGWSPQTALPLGKVVSSGGYPSVTEPTLGCFKWLLFLSLYSKQEGFFPPVFTGRTILLLWYSSMKMCPCPKTGAPGVFISQDNLYSGSSNCQLPF